MKPASTIYRYDERNPAEPYLDLLKKALTGYLYDESAWVLLDPTSNTKFFLPFVRKLIIKLLAKKSFCLVKTIPFNSETRANGSDWPMIGYTMVGLRRLDNLQSCIERAIINNVAGDFVECGVWRGGASILARAVFKSHNVTDRDVWLADSFEGMPVPTKDDVGDMNLSGLAYLSVSVEKVKENFERFGLLDEHVRFIKGWFSETLPTAPVKRISVLRLDGDHYSSTSVALNSLYDKVSPGGFIIIDDYFSFPSCNVAVTEFFTKRGIESQLYKIDGESVYWQRS